MKLRQYGYLILIIFTVLLFSQCASTGFLMAKAKVTLFGDTFPAKDEDAKIDIFMTNKPNQEYIEFAQITCGDTNDKWSLKQITKKALEIGADGIIIIGKAGSSGVGIPVGNSTYVVSEEYGMTAVALQSSINKKSRLHIIYNHNYGESNYLEKIKKQNRNEFHPFFRKQKS